MSSLVPQQETSSATSDQEDQFKATKIWQDVITAFRAGMPRRRRRIKMHFYEDCFTGLEAVDWLHAHLQSSPLFGDVSRQQAKTLLQKFLSSDVIQEVRGKLRTFKEEGFYLYQFVTEPGPFNFVGDENCPPQSEDAKRETVSSLGKRRRKERRCLYKDDDTLFANEYASTSFDENNSMVTEGGRGMGSSVCLGEMRRADNILSSPVKKHRDDQFSEPMETSSRSTQAESENVTPLEATVWKELTLNRLLLLVDLPSLDGVLTHGHVDGNHIAQNVASVARMVGGVCSSAAQSCLAAINSGCGSSLQPIPQPLAPASCITRRRSSCSVGSLGTRRPHPTHRPHPNTTDHKVNADPELPRWVSLSLHCLSNWPDSCSKEFVGGMPIYGGFELDVFQSIVHYFRSKPDSLTTSHLYDLYMAVLELVKTSHTHSVEALQLCCLMLPQGNWTKLHRVLKFIHKASINRQLHLSKTRSNQAVLLEEFIPVIIRKSRKIGSMVGEEKDHHTLVTFMTNNCHSIFKVPSDLTDEVQQRLKKLQEGQDSPLEVRHAFCRQVSRADYEEEQRCTSVQSMEKLLENILDNKTMSDKCRRQKLKMFQKQYPDIYHAKFPKSAPEVGVSKKERRPKPLIPISNIVNHNRGH